MSELDSYAVFLFLIVGAAFYLGMRYAEYRIVKQMLDSMTPDERDRVMKLAEKSDDELKDAWRKDIGNITYEVVGNSHIFYGSNGQFLCQGNSLEDVALQFKAVSSAPKIALVTAADGDTLTVVNGRVVKDAKKT
jgi:hypothetical protein